jgi:hypothetical protein
LGVARCPIRRPSAISGDSQRALPQLSFSKKQA